jgi:hypothetical protein
MVAPVIAAGARVAGKTAARAATGNSVRNAQRVTASAVGNKKRALGARQLYQAVNDNQVGEPARETIDSAFRNAERVVRSSEFAPRRAAANDNWVFRRAANDNQTRSQKKSSLVNQVRSITGGATDLRDRAKTLQLLWPLITVVGPLLIGQVAFGLLSLAGLSVEAAAEGLLWGVFAGLVPADRVLAAGYIVAAICGLMAMLAAFLTYTLSGVALWRYGRINWFGICLIGSLAPLVNIFPWALLFIAAVTFGRRSG